MAELDTAFIKVPWTTQPPAGTPLDMSHPMAQDLAFFCVFNDGERAVDLVNNRVGTPITGGSSFITSETQIYNSRSIRTARLDSTDTASETGWIFGDHPEYDLTRLSFAASARDFGIYDTGWSRIFSKRFTAPGDDVYACMLSNQNNLYFRLGDDSASSNSHLNQNLARTSGFRDWFDVIGYCNGALAFTQWYTPNVTAQPISTQTFVSGVREASLSSGKLCIGHRDEEDRSWDGWLEYVALWNKPKSVEFLQTFRLNPYQIFKPKTIFLGKPEARRVVTF